MKRVAVAAAFALLAARRAEAANCGWDIVPTNINFGTYSGSVLTATSSFQFTCTPSVATATLMLSRGASSTYNPRSMTRTTAPVSTANYNLYLDAANTMIWGDGTSGTQFLTFSPAPGNKTFAGTIYGTMNAGLNLASGTYTDTILATLDWGGGSSSQFFTVTVTVTVDCTVSTTSVDFGTYDPVSANVATPKDSTGTVDVFCTNGTLATVSLDLGSHLSGTTRRMMSAAANFLNYEIYRDSSHTVVWNGTNTDSGTSTSNTIPINGGFSAYGRIPAGQDAAIGNYTDVVMVTVNY